MHTLAQLPLTHRFALLPDAFFSRQMPTPLPDPGLVAWNSSLAGDLGLQPDPAQQPDLAEILAGNRLPANSQPLASVYSGHQFGVNVPQLGDGRAILIGEYASPAGNIVELQLKGAGKTPYSRMGDGRAVLRSSIREYLCSEAMHGLGIPSTRALGLAGSPQTIWREEPETAAVVLRVAPSFVRFGHFEYFYWRGEHAALRTLLDWAIAHFYPECSAAPEPAAALLEQVVGRTASLVAQWQAVGFCHGVLNSDNMSLLGLTLDYGPFGFLDAFDAAHVCNHSDTHGRYAYQQQPEIGLWNLHCLAQALVPLASRDALLAALGQYQPQFEAAFAEQMRRKLGFLSWQDDDWVLLTDLLALLQESSVDWTNFWRRLARLTQTGLRDDFIDRPAFDAWTARYQARLASENQSEAQRQAAMDRANPCYVLRNHLAEVAIQKAQAGDFSEVARLHACLAHPYTEQPDYADYAEPAPEWARAISVSCSS